MRETNTDGAGHPQVIPAGTTCAGVSVTPGRRKGPRTQTQKQTPVSPLCQESLAPSPPSRFCFPIPAGSNWKRTLALPRLRTQA